MTIIIWLVLGALLAWAARMVSFSSYGAASDIAFAAAGAVVAGAAATLAQRAGLNEFTFLGVVAALAGAAIALRVSHMVIDRREGNV